MEENILRIAYQRGNFNVNLDSFLPCTQKEFKMVLELINQAANMEELVNELYAYIAEKLEQDVYSIQYLRKFTTFDGYKKKMSALKDILEKNYTFLTIRPTEEPEKKVTAKSAIVYVLNSKVYSYDMPDAKLEVVIGWRFNKAGYNFELIKVPYGNKERYVLKLYGITVNSEYYTSRTAAVEAVNEKLLSILEKNAERLAIIKSQYEKLMLESGYMTVDEIKKPEAVTVPETKSQVAENTEKRNTEVAAVAEKVAPIKRVEKRNTALPGRPAYIGCFMVQSSGRVIQIDRQSLVSDESAKCAIGSISGSPTKFPTFSGGHCIRTVRDLITAQKAAPIYDGQIKTKLIASLERGG